MADKKISALPSATLPLAGTEIVPLVQGGVTSKALASDLFQWPSGRVTYVPIGGNIQAYVTAATAGDTLILGAGTYVVTATITVNKAILIKGQGLSATKVTTATADLAVFTLTASSARITDLYIGNTGTGTSYGIFVGDGLTQLQVSFVIAVLGGNGLKYGIWSQSSITVSNCEMYITSADLNSNGLMIYNDSAATANISANIQNVRVLSTGATLNNRGIVFNNNNTTKTIAGNVTNCNLTAYASTGVTDIALYVNSTTTFNVTVNAYNSLFSGADSDVTVISTNSCTLTNCTLVNGTVTGTVVYSGTQVVGKVNGNTVSATGIILTSDATDSSSTTTGSIKTAGGLGVAKIATVNVLHEITGEAWTAYTPTITVDAGTIGTPTINLARYRILGKTLFLQLNVTVSVTSGAPSEIRCTLPDGRVSPNASMYTTVWVTNNSLSRAGLLRQTAASYGVQIQDPTSVYVWAGSCAFYGSVVLELT